jgi:hypothetical protein
MSTIFEFPACGCTTLTVLLELFKDRSVARRSGAVTEKKEVEEAVIVSARPANP